MQKLKSLLMHENILTSKYIQKEIACFKKTPTICPFMTNQARDF